MLGNGRQGVGCRRRVRVFCSAGADDGYTIPYPLRSLL